MIGTRHILAALTLTAALCGQMEKRWSGLFRLSKYERQAPAVGTTAPSICCIKNCYCKNSPCSTNTMYRYRTYGIIKSFFLNKVN